jgi:hypothetical protein
MSDNPKFGDNDPLSIVVEYLEKANYDKLAEQVIDVFATTASKLEQVNLIAKLYLDVRNLEKTEYYAKKVLEMAKAPDEKYNARANLAKLYNNFNEPAKSLFYSRLNKAVDPENPEVKLEMLFSTYLLGEKDKAREILDDLKSKINIYDERTRDTIRFNEGTYLMEEGHFLEGLGAFLLNVKKLKLWFSPEELPYKFWDGGAYPGKTLVLFMEGGGIGDEFITIRWMNKLKDIGFNPVYYTSRKDLYNIFTNCGFNCIINFDNVPKDAMWTYAMQVPLYLKCKPEEVSMGNYLYASDEARKKWAWLKETPKKKIGVRWQGNSKNERDLHRQVPLDGIMETLKSVYGNDVDYYSLQIGDGAEQASNYPELIDLTKDIISYDDTFAMLENLDLVVTSCTSVLHASAIVGTPTMCMIPISAYFTWLGPPTEGRDTNTSIWYPDNVRVFKQTKLKNWDKPFFELKKYLRGQNTK